MYKLILLPNAFIIHETITLWEMREYLLISSIKYWKQQHFLCLVDTLQDVEIPLSNLGL